MKLCSCGGSSVSLLIACENRRKLNSACWARIGAVRHGSRLRTHLLQDGRGGHIAVATGSLCRHPSPASMQVRFSSCTQCDQ